MFRKSPPSTTSDDRVTVTEHAPCQKSLRIRVAPEAIEPVRHAVLAEFQKEATLPGFRKGKAPVELVARQYGSSIHEETLHRVTKQAFEDAAKTHRLRTIGPFQVSKAEFTEPNGLMLEARVEVEPEFALGSYKGIQVHAQPVAVSAQELSAALTKLQESMAQMVPTGAGDTKTRQVPPLDDELAKDAGFETVEKLKVHVEAKLLEQKRASVQEQQEATVCDELLKRHTFEVPPSLVVHQTERLTQDFKVRLLLSGMVEPQVNDEVGKFTEQLRTSAQRHVKLGFILDRIAEAETVQVTQDEIMRRLWDVARRWKKDPAEVRKVFDEQGLWPSVVSTIRQEKTMTQLMEGHA